MEKLKAGEVTIDPKLVEIIVDNLGVDEEEVTGNASLVDDLGADSLDQVEIVMAIEEHYDIEIPDDEMERFKTVQDVADYIRKKKGQPK